MGPGDLVAGGLGGGRDRGERDDVDPASGPSSAHSSTRCPPIEAPTTNAHDVMPSVRASSISTATWSRVVTRGNRLPHGRPSGAARPVRWCPGSRRARWARRRTSGRCRSGRRAPRATPTSPRSRAPVRRAAHVRVAGEGVQHEDGVRPVGRERAPSRTRPGRRAGGRRTRGRTCRRRRSAAGPRVARAPRPGRRDRAFTRARDGATPCVDESPGRAPERASGAGRGARRSPGSPSATVRPGAQGAPAVQIRHRRARRRPVRSPAPTWRR